MIGFVFKLHSCSGKALPVSHGSLVANAKVYCSRLGFVAKECGIYGQVPPIDIMPHFVKNLVSQVFILSSCHFFVSFAGSNLFL